MSSNSSEIYSEVRQNFFKKSGGINKCGRKQVSEITLIRVSTSKGLLTRNDAKKKRKQKSAHTRYKNAHLMSHCINPRLKIQELWITLHACFPQLQNDVWQPEILNLIFGEYPNLLVPAEEHKHRRRAGSHLCAACTPLCSITNHLWACEDSLMFDNRENCVLFNGLILLGK